MLVLGVDGGNNGAKVAGPYGIDMSKTAICEWFERDVEESFGDDDVEFEIGGRRGFAGSIAENEDEFGGGSMFGDTKAHEDVKIRVLLAITRYIKKFCPHEYIVRIVVGQPVKTHKESEKKKIKEMLTGKHVFIVNGEENIIHIESVIVATEGGGAFWSCPQDGTIRILDVGSGTVNAVTVKDKNYINNGSDTFNFGIETIKNKDNKVGLARGIVRSASKLKWHKNDMIYVCGGIADKITPFIKKDFPNTEILNPQLQYNGRIVIAHPVFANAIGFYNIARSMYR